MSEERHNRTTVERDALRVRDLRPVAEPRATIVIYGHDDTRVLELRPGESVMVGRAPPAEVVVEDMTISRRHARFRYIEGHVEVEDLGSRNGTLVHGARVNKSKLRSGDDVRLGGVAVSIHLRGGAEQPLGLSSYDRLLIRLEEELVRARTFGHRLSVIAVFAQPRPGAGRSAAPAPASPGAVDVRHVSRWAPRVRSELRPGDLIAVHGPHSVLVLMPDAEPEAVEQVSKRLTRLVEGLTLSCGIASFPETARSSGALVSEAHTAARSASAQRPVQHGRSAAATEPGEAIVLAPAMQRLFQLADRIAVNDVPVLILGETGTGKEVLARHVHQASRRRDQRMIVINCAALPANLIESALFGHEKGAFTGADTQKKGVFEEGDRSTVFLDEVGELSAAAQAALLRVLETKRFSRVGSAREIEVDARIVAATHRDLEAMVEAHTFRADLYYRLNTMTLKVPPLRDRTEEIMPLARALLAQTVAHWNTTARDFAPETQALLCAYRWPGNVRELRNVIERAAVISTSERLLPEDLPERVRTWTEPELPALERVMAASASLPPPPLSPLAPGEEPGSVAFRDRIRDYELKLITDALDAAGGNQSRAAELLRIPLRTLVHKIRTYGLKKSYKRDGE